MADIPPITGPINTHIEARRIKMRQKILDICLLAATFVYCIGKKKLTSLLPLHFSLIVVTEELAAICVQL